MNEPNAADPSASGGAWLRDHVHGELAALFRSPTSASHALPSDRRPDGQPLYSTCRIAVAFSGGRDSLALLDALACERGAWPLVLSAVHVHHGLMADADTWAAQCAARCDERGIALTLAHVRVERTPGASVEAAAREARYAVLRALPVDIVALAHHADDQVETVLLQLLRGAGPAGLAAMPMLHVRGPGPKLWRPLLALPRAAIDAYARAASLPFVDDASNAEARWRRNWIRGELLPMLEPMFPGARRTLARSARLQAEAAELLDELAALDARDAVTARENGSTLEQAALRRLHACSPPRARNLLRWFIRREGLPAPSAARLADMLAQCLHARSDARIDIRHGGVALGVHRGAVMLHAVPRPFYAVGWHGERELALPGGILEFHATEGHGIARRHLVPGKVEVRPAQGGERLKLALDRPSQRVRKLWQAVGRPWWERADLPLLWRGEQLVAVPGMGVDVAFQAAPMEPAWDLHWQRKPAAEGIEPEP